MVNKKDKKTGKEKNLGGGLKKAILLSNLESKTRRTIGSIAALCLGVILLLAGFSKAGVAGNDLYKAFSYLLGIGYFVLPVLSIVIAVSLGSEQDEEERGHRIIGGILFFISSLAFIELVSPSSGGIVGSSLANPLQKMFDFYASIIIATSLLLVSLMILFEFSFGLNDIYTKIGHILKAAFARIFGKKEDMSAAPVANQTEEEIGAVAEAAMDKISDVKEVEENHTTAEEDEEDIVGKVRQREEGVGSSNEEATPFPFMMEEFTPPPISLLEQDRGKPGVGDIKANANIIKRTLSNFGIAIEMDEISIGPAVTRYAIKPAEGVRLQKIVALQQNLELALAAHPIRIEAPIPGKSLVGIEVPNTTKSIVGLGSMFASEEFKNSDKPLLVALGRGITGKSYFSNIAKMPHGLIAGATGSGKSVMIHTLITSLLFRNSPENLRFIMIDPKRVELTLYNGIPHLLNPVITDAKKAIMALKWAAKEMDRRYDILETEKVRDIDSYHKNILSPALERMREGRIDEGEKMPEMMPYICIFIDELADIMQAYPRELEAAIVRLAQMSRAVGIHLILSTQRPSVNVITGLIKANVPTRIALQVASAIDSRTILDMGGAEKLLGAGDLLYLSADMAQPQRMQSPFITENEVKKVVKYLIKAGEHIPPSEINFGNTGDGSGGLFASAISDGEEEADDDLYEEAREIVIKAGKASTSYLQRRLRIGYARAARLMDILEEKGVIGPGEGAKPREVLIKSEGYGATEEDTEAEA